MGRWIVSFCVALSLVGCNPRTEPTPPKLAANDLADQMAMCSAALVTTSQMQQHESHVQLAILTAALSRSSSNEQLQSALAGLTGGGYFDGTLDGARSRQAELQRQLNITFDASQSFAVLNNFLPTNASDAYNRCIANVFGDGRLQITSEVINPAQSLVQIRWPGREGDTGSYYVEVSSNGTTDPKPTTVAASGGRIQFVVRRQNPAQPLIVLAQLIRVNDRQRRPISAVNVTFPPVTTYIQQTPSISQVESTPSVARCGNPYGSLQASGPIVRLAADSPGVTYRDVTLTQIPVTAGGDHRDGVTVAGRRSGMFFDQQSPTLITAHAECGCGDCRYKHMVTGVIQATRVLAPVVVKPPQDTGRTDDVRVILPRRPR